MKGLLILLAVVMAGCACSAADCTSGVTVRAGFDVLRDMTYDVEVCFDDRCQHALMGVNDPAPQTGAIVGALTLWEDADRVDLDLGAGDFSGTHDISMSIHDEAGDEISRWTGSAEMARFEPNGPMCGPMCWHAEVGP